MATKAREQALRRWAQLSQDRTGWLEHWRELSQWFLPRSGRFTELQSNTPNQGGKKHQHILDNSPVHAVNIATAGLMSGASSPARQWFKLRTPYDDLNNRPAVKAWLDMVEKRMRDVFNASNVYRVLRQAYQELLVFGTFAAVVLEDRDNVVHLYPMTAGEYALDVDDKGQVSGLYRRMDLRVGQVVQRFGYKACSQAVRSAYDTNNLNAFITVLHQIEPRRDRNPVSVSAKDMPWTSNYYELNNTEGALRESGYPRFPVVAPRWETRGADAYGSSPGMVALGDTKQLQQEQLRKSQAIDFMSLPPIQVPPGSKVDITPGAVNYVDVAGGGNTARNLMDVRMDISALREDIEDVRRRIDRAFYADMFLLIAADSRAQPATAREIAERHEEKLLMLGPVLEALHDELLAPLVETTFHYMLNAGLLPPAPKELAGLPLVVQFVSLLALAQRMVGLSNLDRLVGFIYNAAAATPDILDKLNRDKLVDVYAETLGTDPTVIRSEDEVAEVRAERSQQQAQMEAVAAAPELARAAKDATLAEQASGGLS